MQGPTRYTQFSATGPSGQSLHSIFCTQTICFVRAKRLVKRRALPNVCATLYIQRFAPERFADVQPKKGEFCTLHSYQTFGDQTFGAQTIGMTRLPTP